MFLKEEKVSGHIDTLIGGLLTGWCAIIGDTQRLGIVVETSGGIVVGRGIADKYRDDLRANGVNDGSHGFQISLDCGFLYTKSELRLKRANDNQELGIASFKVPNDNCNARIVFESVLGNELTFSLLNPELQDDLNVNFRIAEKIIGSYKVEGNVSQSVGSIVIPADYLDDTAHIIVAFINDKSFPCGWDVICIGPALLSSEKLSKRKMQYDYLGMASPANHRYESLVNQLNTLSNSSVPFDTLIKAHKLVLEESIEKNLEKKLKFPSCGSPKVSVIILGSGILSATFHCLGSLLLAHNATQYEAILIHDGLSYDSSDIESIFENLIVRKLQSQDICPYAEGAALASGEYIVFLNDTLEVTSFWIDELIEKYGEDESVGLFGGKLISSAGAIVSAGGFITGRGQVILAGKGENPHKPEWNYTRQVDFIPLDFICISKRLWKQLGGFDGRLKDQLYTAADFAFRARELGFKVLFKPSSIAIQHDVGRIQGHVDDDFNDKGSALLFKRNWLEVFNGYDKCMNPLLSLDRDRSVFQRILMIDYSTPMLGVDAGSYAAINEMKMMLALGFKVTFVPKDLVPLGVHLKQLQKMGVEVLTFPFYNSVSEILRHRLLEMDAVYITRFNVAKEYIDEIKSFKKPVLFNNADLHFLRELRSAFLKNNNDKAIEKALLTRNEELAVCSKADAILTYTSTEQTVIASHLLRKDVFHTTPWVVSLKDEGPEFKVRNGISFIGGYDHKPNVEAVHYLVKQIMPKLFLRNPEIKLFIYGSNMPEEFNEFAAVNVEVVGYADELAPVYQTHRIFVAPLQSGAGIKGKVLDAAAYSTPTILSDIAAEGTGLTQGVNALIANTPEDWVEAILKLYDDKALWERLCENGRLLITENHSFADGVMKFKRIFESVGVYSLVNENQGR